MRRRKRRARAAGDDALAHSGLLPYLRTFLEASAAAGLSERTVAIRERELRRFIAWADARGLARPGDVTRGVLERYRRHLFHYRKANGEPLAFATQAQRLLPIRAWFKWLARENHVLYNPAAELTLPRVPRRLPRHLLSAEEVEQVLHQATLGPLGVRDRAILEVLYATGIRRAELIHLSVYDVDTGNGTLLVRQGKGGKDRYVPLGPRAGAWVERYLDELRPALAAEPDDATLFLHEDGAALTGSQLTDRVRKHLDAAGIAKPGACHLFRHTMATLMLDNGADLRFIQAILGHADLATTQIYTHVSIAKLKAVHALTHPAGRVVDDEAVAGAGDHHDTDRNARTADTLFTTLAAEAEEETDEATPSER